MSYTDRLMSTGERIVTSDRQHWFVVLASGRYGVAAVVGAIILLVVQAAVGTSDTSGLLGAAAAILLVGGLVMLVWEVLRYQNQQYIITNRRVIQVSGVINKNAGDSSLEKINDADLSQSLLGRMFNFGDLDVLTASDAGIDRFRMIHDPVGFKRAMLDAKHEYEQDMARGPMPVSPPLRTGPESRPAPVDRVVPSDPDATSSHPVAAPPPGPHGDPRRSDWPSEGQANRSHAPAAQGSPPPAAPAAPASPAAPTPPRMTPDEVTRTLASLADLRDRGALSAEEFEHKKADLLGRL